MRVISDNFAKGGIAQAKTEIRAMEKGYIVSKPITEGTRYDIVIDNGVKLSRIQIKYAGNKQSFCKGSVLVDFRKRTNSGKQKKRIF